MAHKNKPLFWYQWSNVSSTSYIHLIDYDGKLNAMKSLPWFFIPSPEKEVLQFCETSIFGTYKRHILSQLKACDRTMVPNLMKKLLHICEIYEIVWKNNEASSLYRNIVEYLCDHYNDDPNLLLEVWNVLCGPSDSAKIAVFSSLGSRFNSRRNATILRFILKSAQMVRFGFWGAWVKNNELEECYFCPVTSALVCGNLEQLTVLLQHGFQQNSRRVSVYDNYFLSDMPNALYSWLKKPFDSRHPGRRSILAEVLIFLVQASNCSYDLEFACRVKCFRLLWNTTPVPLVTRSELRKEVLRRFGNPHQTSRPFPRELAEFLKLCKVYTWVQPEETADAVQPRSLQHLSKCAIRRALTKSWNLPGGIEDLPLPMSLKTYLNV